jgi:alkylation response protein AidB-like acyl-CoA dehydrogenase
MTPRDGSAPSRPSLLPDHAAVLEKIGDIAAQAAARAEEIDLARRFPEDLFGQLVATGVFYATAPREYGGLDMPLDLVNEAIILSARANGSLGWLMMVGTAQGSGFGMFSKPVIDELHATMPRARRRGVIAPKGVAIPTEGGYVISGRWPFGSGGPNPQVVSANCIVLRDGKPSIGPDGVPDAIMALLPASQAEFLDNWHVLGMRGTDSCDIVFRDVFVPAEKTANIFTARSFFDNPIARMRLRVVLSMGHTSVAIGLAQGALDDILELAATKRSSMNPNRRLHDEPIFRHFLGEHTLRLRACRAMLDDITAKAWAAGVEGRELTPREILEGRTMSAFVTAECVKIVDWAYTAGGSSVVYDSAPLQRRLRDIHVATQHASTFIETYGTLAAVVLGEQVSPMELF